VRKVILSRHRSVACLTMLVAVWLCSCDRLGTELTSSCHEIETSIPSKAIRWETANSAASIDEVVVECLPLKDASSYRIVATAKITTQIDEVFFKIASPLTDAIKFEALSAKGVVIGHGEVSYKMPRLRRTENVSAVFTDLSASEVRSITKVVVGWSYE